MTEPKFDPNAASKLKRNFLKLLQNSVSIEAALQAAEMEPIKLLHYLERDKGFETDFHKIINQKLELAFLDCALQSKTAAILSFALTNRLAEKYNKPKTSALPPETPAQIIFTDTADDGEN